MRHIGLNLGGRARAAFMSASLAVLLATASLAAPVLAADQQTTAQVTDTIGPHTHQIHGVVKGTPAAGATSFTVTTDRYGDVAVTFAGAQIPGRGKDHGHARSFLASASDLKDGDRVVVQGRTSPDGKTFIARRVHPLPAKGPGAHATHLVGTISGVSSGSNGSTTLTVTPASGGAAQTVTVMADTRIHPNGKTVADLKVGTRVTVVSKNGTATGVVVMPD
jgi:hypothetical protein